MNHNIRVAIMQPYFLPYIGYWQLMHHVDIFVVYDDIEYTKKGWINRNRFLLNGQPETFTLPLKKDSDYLDIRQRELSDTFSAEKIKLMRRIEAVYRNAPFFQEGKALLDDVFACKEINLFQFIFQSIEKIHARLGITTRLVASSQLGVSRLLKGQDRVIATCKVLNATDYINPIGGIKLYDRGAFFENRLRLHFQNVKPYHYQQFNQDFIAHLSILDVFMFLDLEKIKYMLEEMNLC